MDVRNKSKRYPSDGIRETDNYSSFRFYSFNSNEINEPLDDKYIELLNVIKKKYKTPVKGRTKIFTNYDFVIVESLVEETNHKFRKINIITQNPIQLVQFDKNGNQRLILQGDDLMKLLKKLQLEEFFSNTEFDFKQSGYKVIANAPNADWTHLQRNEIALFREGENYYYGIRNENNQYEKYLLLPLNALQNEQLKSFSSRISQAFDRGNLTWEKEADLITHVLSQAQENGHIFERRSIVWKSEQNFATQERALHPLHTALTNAGGEPLFNNDKISLVFISRDLEQKRWQLMLKNQMPDNSNFKETTVIVKSIPAVYQYDKEGNCVTLLEGENCQKAFDEAKLPYLDKSKKYESNQLIDALNLDKLDKLNQIIVNNNGKPITGLPDHPVVRILNAFNVRMVREQQTSVYSKSISFTFKDTEVENILETFKRLEPDNNEMMELQDKKQPMMWC